MYKCVVLKLTDESETLRVRAAVVRKSELDILMTERCQQQNAKKKKDQRDEHMWRASLAA